MKAKLLNWLLSGKTYAWLLKYVIPYIRFTMYYSLFPGTKYHEAYALLEPGDIIVTDDHRKLTSLLIPGVWAHAALCVGKDKVFEVAEMTHKDFTKSTFFDVCKESERVAIYRCKDFDPAYIEQMIEVCKSFEGAKYDNVFDLNVEALYCSELVWQADFESRLQVKLDDLVGLGRQYISPTGLTKAANVVCIYDSGPAKA